MGRRAVLWFEHAGKFDEFVADPNYMSDVFPDEQAFLHHEGLVFQLVEDEGRVIIGD